MEDSNTFLFEFLVVFITYDYTHMKKYQDLSLYIERINLEVVHDPRREKTH
jgi:hypothetical protein